MENPENTLKKLTLEEKAALCSGKDFWLLKGVERLSVPNIMVADGPHGLRKQPDSGESLGANISKPSTCFPTSATTANSWDRSLIYKVGQAIADECLKEKVSVLLGPGINIKRSPLCGRNFEYYSEDPYFTGEMAAAFIEGVQSKGVGTSLKHFAANNQENNRMTINAVIDERAFREIYLAGFERAVKKAKPWTLMCSYNKINGAYSSDNKRLLTDILRDEWGFEGLVMSDWGAVNERVEGVKAGLDLEMPGNQPHNDKKIIAAINNGTLDIKELDRVVLRVLELIKKAGSNTKEDCSFDFDTNHQLAKTAAANSAVLMKNQDSILPLNRSKKIAVIGEMARLPRYQGSGSSLINPVRLENTYDSLKEQGIQFEYTQGYIAKSDDVDDKLIKEACSIAGNSEIVLIFAGLTALYESEGFDREHEKLPENQNTLIEAVADVNKNIVVILSGGSPVEMPWIDKVKAILNMYLPGQAGGAATVDLLFGKVNPSGKLAETYPIRYSDYPVSSYFPEGPKTVEYRESIYVGYRYYDTAKKQVLFPFGHGLSYTTIEYSGLMVSSESITDRDTLKVSLNLRNTGAVSGAEIVQLYVHDVESTVFKAEKELKGFDKVFLQPGEEKTVEFILDKRSFAYYSVNKKDWCVESGKYDILVGASSRDIRLVKTINIASGDIEPDYDSEALSSYYIKDGEFKPTDEEFEALYGDKLPSKQRQPKEPYTFNSTIEEIRKTFTGYMIYKISWRQMSKISAGTDENAVVTLNMMRRMLPEFPLRSMVSMGGGFPSAKTVEGFLLIMNGKRIRGLLKVLTSLIRK
ncbi:MAG: glycoside hydrolase family 3 C-terminal domain-containing protein [Bacillota bacterium]|nr:glycoside hydrolase family 3 C-terminal domain-containing protein [Bacillota bacterium]